jgi:ferrochelatase
MHYDYSYRLFGGPERPEDVIPRENTPRGRMSPASACSVAGHYDHFDGCSPINQQCRDLIAAPANAFHPDLLGIATGNRYRHTVRQMAADGVRRAPAIATGTSKFGRRQYIENIEAARRG